MTHTLIMLIAMAHEKYGFDITPCTGKRFRDCLQEVPELGYIYLYFNTLDHSTHVVRLPLQNK